MAIINEDPQINTNSKERPKSLTHAQINGAFNPLTPAEAASAVDKYGQIASRWTDGVTVFAARIQRSSAAAWEGTAADSARAAINTYTQRANELTPSLNALAVRVENAVTAITRTKTNLPDQVGDRGFIPDSMPMPGGSQNSKRDDAEEDAQEVMSTDYLDPFVTADGQIPKLPEAVSPTNPLYVPPKPGDDNEPGSGNPSSGDPGSDDPGSGDPSTGETPEGTTEEEPTTEEQPTAEDTTDDDSTDDNSPEDTSTNPAGTTPEVPNTTTTPSGTTPGTPGAPTTTGSPGTTQDPPSPGRSVAAAPGQAAVGTTTSAQSATNAAGRNGMPGMMPPGAGGKKGEGDEEHSAPDYLITAENTAELLGELPKTVPGGVIGANTPSAQPPPAEPPAGN